MNNRENVDYTRSHLLVVLLRVVEIHEHSTHTVSHADRVATISHLIGKELGLPERELGVLWRSALLHDIGKVGIGSDILLSSTKLTNEQWIIVRNHSIWGQEILRPTKYFRTESIIVRQHHERYDGKGYPDGLKGKEILLLSRIIIIADVFDALVTFRAYKNLWNSNEAREFIYKQSNLMFDPRLVKIFLKISESNKFLQIYQRF